MWIDEGARLPLAIGEGQDRLSAPLVLSLAFHRAALAKAPNTVWKGLVSKVHVGLGCHGTDCISIGQRKENDDAYKRHAAENAETLILEDSGYLLNTQMASK